MNSYQMLSVIPSEPAYQDGVFSQRTCNQVQPAEKEMFATRPRFTVIPVHRVTEGSMVSNGNLGGKEKQNCSANISVLPSVVVTEASSDELLEDEEEEDKYVSPAVESCWALLPYKPFRIIPLEIRESCQHIPPSLAPVVLPSVPSSTTLGTSQSKRMKQSIHHLLGVPHGATVPPLHDLTCNQQLLNHILKYSQKNIDFGCTDGRNIKTVQSISSSQLIETGSVFDLQLNPKEDEGNASVIAEMLESKVRIRPNWRTKLQFILSSVGACIGLHSFWRLPYLCILYGRAAFLIPLLLILWLIGVPLLMAEFTLGQFTQRGPVEAVRQLFPLMQGVGIGNVVLSLAASVYYSLLFSDTILILGLTMGGSHKFCNATEEHLCSHNLVVLTDLESLKNETNATSGGLSMMLPYVEGSPSTEAIVAHITTIIGTWIITFFILWKSVRSIGKATVISATVPFVLIAAVFWRAVTLPGATIGLQYFFTPDWQKLLEPEAWVNAAIQVLITLNLVFGPSVTYASYNKFYNNYTSDILPISCAGFISSLLGVLIVFSGVGNISLETGFDIASINFKEDDLVFVVYPRILSRMPQKYIWASLFFLLIALLGLNSQFSSAAVLVTSLQDNTYRLCKWIFEIRHEAIVAGVCILCFICSLPFVLKINRLSLHLTEFKAVYTMLLFMALCETVTFMWLFGSSLLSKSIRQMTGKAPSNYYSVCWKYLTPVSLTILWILSCISLNRQSFRITKDYMQATAMVAGWIFIFLALVPIPTCVFVYFYKWKWSLKGIKEDRYKSRKQSSMCSASNYTN